MEGNSPEELQRELDRLWQRVTHGPPEGMPSAPPTASSDFIFADSPSITQEASMEAISLVKRQHRSEVLRLKQLVELKDQSVRELKSRLAETETDLQRMRAASQRQEEAVYQEVLNVSAELDSARKGLDEQARRHEEEQKVLRSIAENMRRQLASEATRWREAEHSWNEREQQYLLELRELQTRAERLQQQSAKGEVQAARSHGELSEAKNAIEKTLAELLLERQERETAAKERDKALARVKEVEEHVLELQNLWQEERAQWQELWDRERSTWESQRQQFRAWEERVQKQREDFHQNLEKMEERDTTHAGNMAEVLRKSSDSVEKINTLLRSAAETAKNAATTAAVAALGPRPIFPGLRFRSWRAVVAAAAVAVLLAASVPVYRYMTRFEAVLASSHAIESTNPTGIAYDGNVVWISQWDGRLTSVDPKDPAVPLRTLRVNAKAPYHPAGMVLWGEKLYSLDTGQSRIFRHSLAAPETVEESWPTPGPAPTALASDGQNLWTYDAATRQMYRHLGEGPQSQSEPYSIPSDLAPSAIAWHRGELWLVDAKQSRLLIFTRNGRVLELQRSTQLAEPLSAILLTQTLGDEGGSQLELWGLSVPSVGLPTFKKFRIRK
ncbi:MAG: hypothetical protein CO113_11410 [Elusimicrobia bacterium CG_4_9_14_3_um_filter_62_55]|nr:MAG: hypothetical protein COR54_07335 [Elusimicrobia bacterium CG22_combo_CG10-13_8_21_14_all_63_91]PJA16860.1 MAG: hypothetical protein COX66_06230 [Elusimicrobia bacterium CG_4_10_14_0_2_um_filter_63_34]PJB24948.1 MAG: hypothetical protein CO113_11410 [Elusimicrobia bacterium CG_4_9_14_3_um_filter_62_55]